MPSRRALPTGSNIAVTDMMNARDAKHILVVADSCYSGAMSRSPFVLRSDSDARNLNGLANGRSRTAFSSGDLRPVLDGGGGTHSVFAKALLDALAINREVLDGRRLYQQIAVKVATAASKFKIEQIPEYAPLRFAGHESGDFIFVPVTVSAAQKQAPSASREVAGQ